MKRNLFIFLSLILFVFCLYQVINSKTEEVINQEASFLSITKIEEEFIPEKIAFVGDMMFDRGVERLMIKNSFTYPIDLIKGFLNKFDIVIGNLEGPINEKPGDFTDSSLKFSFDKRALESLNAGNFSVLSLANNHTLNMGKEGLQETKSILTESGINFTGDPTICDIADTYQKDGIAYFGINKTYSFNCSDKEVVASVEEYKFYNPESFLVILIHWGNEYQETSSSQQQKLGRAMIDAGADLIIGSHPHVIQNIEIYNNKLIFYSLGNFIFDQYFSKETQQGLIIGLEIYKDEKIYSIYPVESVLSQPQLMEDLEEFLENLASISSEELRESIKKGKIKL
ncbi:MAG: CapA family protein [Candidatus Pacebacteria bacterium]|nr:CapA family protein [Candidatus Paceibacterota bacterium]MDD2757031.1 CapA family protein [Candidatus Paceibacterota bacterium]MDD3283540.1 CapA family protein [Candidatus Paceibacterota bacterium]MDD3969603.1 CapA family protein [Candidatus Paceibacterota bacterium]MDD4737851.1 CapA family protein [Candidatus Paceibacterota bacterium]